MRLKSLEAWLEPAIYRVGTGLAERLSAYASSQPEQMDVFLRYRDLLANEGEPTAVSNLGFRVYSQFDEDGVMLAILAAVGMGSRRLIDIGCGRPMGSNSANLLANWSWQGLLVDANESDLKAADRWYRRHRGTMFSSPAIELSVVTPSNVNGICRDFASRGEIDVLSLDIDGVDYWVWHALDVRPRIVIVEANSHLPPDVLVTVPERGALTKNADFEAGYYGSSAAALVSLGSDLGYRLVGFSRGVNLFFIRNDVIPTNVLPEVSVAEWYATMLVPHWRNVACARALLNSEWVAV